VVALVFWVVAMYFHRDYFRRPVEDPTLKSEWQNGNDSSSSSSSSSFSSVSSSHKYGNGKFVRNFRGEVSKGTYKPLVHRAEDSKEDPILKEAGGSEEIEGNRGEVDANRNTPPPVRQATMEEPSASVRPSCPGKRKPFHVLLTSQGIKPNLFDAFNVKENKISARMTYEIDGFHGFPENEPKQFQQM
jgi:hypothetical protein